MREATAARFATIALAGLLTVLAAVPSARGGPGEWYSWTGEANDADYLNPLNWRWAYGPPYAHPPTIETLLTTRYSLYNATIDIGDGVTVNHTTSAWDSGPDGGSVINVHGTGVYSPASINTNGGGTNTLFDYTYNSPEYTWYPSSMSAPRSYINVYGGGTFTTAGLVGGTRFMGLGRVGNTGVHVTDLAHVTIPGGYYIGSEASNAGVGGGFLMLEGYDPGTQITMGSLTFAIGEIGVNMPNGTNTAWGYASGPADLDVVLTAKNAGGHFNTVSVGSLAIEQIGGQHKGGSTYGMWLSRFNLSTDGYSPVAGDLFTIVSADAWNTGQTFYGGSFNVGWASDFDVAGSTYQLLNDDPTVDGDQPGIYLLVVKPGSVVVSHPGDANRDGLVNLEDFGLLKTNFGASAGAAWEMGDFNGDGTVNLEDFGILKDHFGHTAGAVPLAAVPEPATMSLLVLASLAALRRKR